MKRNFFIIASFPDSLINFRGALIDSLLEKGLCVHVAAPNLDCFSPVRSALEKKGCIVHQIRIDRTGVNPIADIRSFFSLYALIKKVKPHYIMAYTIKPVVYGLLAAALARVPKKFALITGLGYSFSHPEVGQTNKIHFLVQGVSRFLYKSALGCADNVIFQNPDDQCVFYKLRLLDETRPSVVVNGSGVDLNFFALHPLPAEPKFLLIARLLRDKGVREYVEAARNIRANNPLITFSLAGWIDESPNAIGQDELSEWQSSGTINYLGRLDDVRPAIIESSVYVLPSYREGTPRTILEAMSMGRPIVTTDAPGCRETVVHGKNGLLVKARSVSELEKALTAFIENPSLIASMGEKSRAIAEQKYDVHSVNESMLSAMDIF